MRKGLVIVCRYNIRSNASRVDLTPLRKAYIQCPDIINDNFQRILWGNICSTNRLFSKICKTKELNMSTINFFFFLSSSLEQY